jgi:hypothetical protein
MFREGSTFEKWRVSTVRTLHQERVILELLKHVEGKHWDMACSKFQSEKKRRE